MQKSHTSVGLLAVRKWAIVGTIFFLAPQLFADRWLILPPRLELQNESADAGDLARAMALYLKISRVSEIVAVAEGETCLKNAGLAMTQKIRPEALRDVAKNCLAERMLLTRIRRKNGQLEITSKVYFRESAELTDTMVATGDSLLPTLGKSLSERFGKKPATAKENSADLVVAGDTFGGSYADWQAQKNLLLSVDAVKAAYCLVDARGQLQVLKLKAERAAQKDFIDRLRFEGMGSYSDAEAMLACAKDAAKVSRAEGRRAEILLLVSDAPRAARAQISVRAQLRNLARLGRLTLVPASTVDTVAWKFWSTMARELAENATFLPSAQRVKLGLNNGQEWYIFRRSMRLYETRDAEPTQFADGVNIPEKYRQETAPDHLVKLYETLSKNKVISSAAPQVVNDALKKNLAAALRTNSGEGIVWRVLMKQNGQTFYVSLTARDAQKLKVGAHARLFTELKSPSETELLRNRATPTLVVENAYDSAPSLELNVGDYLRNPAKYLRKSLARSSFYILSGEIIQIIPPDTDALDGSF
ncbi:MAG: hypothetical protein JSR44_05070 [Spirochaetes bacterium]|nr:hypothetical protein [Spirochaetota bacterium]